MHTCKKKVLIVNGQYLFALFISNYVPNSIQGNVSRLWLVNFSVVNPKTEVQKSVTAVQKSVTTEGPIKFQIGKQECKFFRQNKRTWRVKFENNNCDRIWLIFYRIGVIKIKYRKIGKFCLLHIYLSRGYGRKFKVFNGKREAQRSRCKYSWIACILVPNIYFYIITSNSMISRAI